MKKYLTLLLLVLFSFCSKKEEDRLPRLIVPKIKNVIQVNTKVMLVMQDYRFLAANIQNDFSLNYKQRRIDKTQDRFYKKIDLDTTIPKYDIKAIVDTSYTFPASRFEYKYVPSPQEIIVDGLLNGKAVTNEKLKIAEKEYMTYLDTRYKQWDDYVECYPLLILNKTKDSILTRFKFIQEAKDIHGKWKPIECYYNFGGCGNPEMFYYNLSPNNYIIYPVIRYYGNFKTKLRIKVYNKGNVYYSNEFVGYINVSQFDTSYLRNSFNLSNPSFSFDEYSDLFFLANKS